jgi:hypothetical protein
MLAETIEQVGLLAEKDGTNQILDRSFQILPGCGPYLRDLIEAMWMEDRIRTAGPISTRITLEEHIKGWQKQKERTAAVSSGPSFSNHKTATDNPDMAEIDHLL